MITTLYNVCSVHRGMFSTSGGYHEYIGGIPWVHRGDTMSTSGGYHEYIGGISWVHRGVLSTSEGYHEYIGGCSVHRRDTMSTSGGYHEYIGGRSWVHRGMFSTSGGYHDTCGGYHEYMGGCSVHRGDTMSTSGGYHEYIGGISWVHRRMFSTSEFSIEIERILSSYSPTCIMISLRCTEHPPMYSWYPPDVLMVSPDVLMVSPRCTEHPPMYSWYPPDVLMISPRCTHGIPPMYWTPPDVLNIPRCTEHTLYRVITYLQMNAKMNSIRKKQVKNFIKLKGQLQRFDKLSLFNRFRHVEDGFNINFWKFIFVFLLQAVKVLKWQLGRLLRKRTGKYALWYSRKHAHGLWRHLRSISTHVFEGRYCTFLARFIWGLMRMAAHYDQHQKEPYFNYEASPDHD